MPWFQLCVKTELITKWMVTDCLAALLYSIFVLSVISGAYFM